MIPSSYSGAEWPDDQIATLKKQWIEGKSASEIAKGLRGRTRNAVIAKVHRLGLTGKDGTRREPSAPEVKRDRYTGNGINARRGKPQKTKPFDLTKSKTDSTPEQRAEKAAQGKAIIACSSDAANDNSILLIARRRSECAWPVGTPERPADQLVCGGRVFIGIEDCPYCLTHAQRAYTRDITKPRTREEDRRAA